MTDTLTTLHEALPDVAFVVREIEKLPVYIDYALIGASGQAILVTTAVEDHEPRPLICYNGHGATRHIWTGNAYACETCAATTAREK